MHQWQGRSAQQNPATTLCGALPIQEFPILADCFIKEFLGAIPFVMILYLFTKLFPPEDFLCHVAASVVSFYARKRAKEFAL